MLTTPDGVQLPPEDVARIEMKDGPAQINRDMGKRRIVVGVNVENRHMGGFVAELQSKVRQQVRLAPGYFIEWGGQFQNMRRVLEGAKMRFRPEALVCAE